MSECLRLEVEGKIVGGVDMIQSKGFGLLLFRMLVELDLFVYVSSDCEYILVLFAEAVFILFHSSVTGKELNLICFNRLSKTYNLNFHLVMANEY